MVDIIHPLELNTVVQSSTPPCSCKPAGSPMEHTTGKVLKIINNHSGIWYFLSSGKTVSSNWVTSVDSLP